MKNKKCSKCGETKHVSEFNRRKASRDGFTARCGQCIRTKGIKTRAKRPDSTRKYNLNSKFNISVHDYNIMFIKQRGVCEICKKPETARDSKGKVKWLAVDHCHNTDKIRGLLCSRCNTGIGKLGDSITVLKSAIKYLEDRGSYGE